MVRTLAAATLGLVLLVPTGARAAGQPTAEDCVLYDAAFKVVAENLGEAHRNSGYRRFAASTFDRPNHARTGTLDGRLSLKRCIALQQRVSAAGLDWVDRSPFGIRGSGSAPYEHFSRPRRDGEVVRLTFYFAQHDGLDLVLRQGPDGAWTADEPEHWLTIDPR